MTETIAGSFDPESSQISRITKRKLQPAEETSDPQQEDPLDRWEEFPPAWMEDRHDEVVPSEILTDQQLNEAQPFSIIASSSTPVIQAEHHSVSDSDSSSSESSDSSSSDLDEAQMPEVLQDDDKMESSGFHSETISLHVVGFDTLQHKQSGVIHRRDPSNLAKLLCGRIASATYCRITAEFKFAWPLCPQCANKLSKLQTELF